MLSSAFFRLGALLLLAVAGSGCTNMALQAKESTAPAPNEVQSLSDSLKPDKVPDAARYTTLGYALVDQSCEAYFAAVIKADNTVKMTKADVVATGSAAAVIAALASAPQKAIGITAAAFGLGSAAVDNYEQYAFATPYPIQTHQLVKKALSAYRQSAPPNAVSAIEDAYDKVAGYARNCTFAGISDLAEQALSTSTPSDLNKNKATFSAAERSTYLNTVDSLVAKTNAVPSDDDYATLDALPGLTDKTQFQTLAGKLSSAIDLTKIFTDAIADPDNETPKFKSAVVQLNLLAASNTMFAGVVSAKVAALKTPVKAGNPPNPPLPIPLPTPTIGISR